MANLSKADLMVPARWRILSNAPAQDFVTVITN